ncbi:FmdB family zinc ribbon protein [Actinoallomurus sp. NPDC050550]|uniref:FmdB family zinc ribbon protein n=1 Tax=Actinoallomurus sp. NPDC050550 TaxID=3154937 RepID=UPI0034060941
MATYEYLCRGCGAFEVRLALGTAPATHACPRCGRGGRRVFSPPALARTSPTARASREREEQSREAPEVVSEVPPNRRAPRRPHPALARLPRP